MSKNKRTPNRNDKYYQGTYDVKNVDKYIGDISRVMFRSKWEYKFCWYCDNNSSIIQWSCEEISIPYQVIEKSNLVTKIYFPDFWTKIIKPNGEEEEFIFEVKPWKQTQEPSEPKRKTMTSLKNYEYRLKDYQLNLLKWDAAKKYCDRRGIKFKVLTEKFFEDKQIKLF